MPNDAADGSKLRCYAKSGPGAAGEISVLASGQPVAGRSNRTTLNPARRSGSAKPAKKDASAPHPWISRVVPAGAHEGSKR